MLAASPLQGQQVETMQVNADRVNLRVAPSIDSDIVRSLSKGTMVARLGRDGAWSKIQVQGQTALGWVRSDLLLAVAGSAAPMQARAPEPPASSSVTPSAPIQRAVDSPPPVQAPQPYLPRQGYKDPGTATLISVFITGGGQFYAGATSRGLMMFAAGDGALIVGCGILLSSTSWTPCGIGLLAYTAVWIYSIVDAAPTARRMNAQNGTRVSVVPIVVPTRQPRVGLALSLRF